MFLKIFFSILLGAALAWGVCQANYSALLAIDTGDGFGHESICVAMKDMLLKEGFISGIDFTYYDDDKGKAEAGKYDFLFYISFAVTDRFFTNNEGLRERLGKNCSHTIAVVVANRNRKKQTNSEIDGLIVNFKLTRKSRKYQSEVKANEQSKVALEKYIKEKGAALAQKKQEPAADVAAQNPLAKKVGDLVDRLNQLKNKLGALKTSLKQVGISLKS